MTKVNLYPTNARIVGAYGNMHIIAKNKKEAINIAHDIDPRIIVTGDYVTTFGSQEDGYYESQVEANRKWFSDPRCHYRFDE